MISYLIEADKAGVRESYAYDASGSNSQRHKNAKGGFTVKIRHLADGGYSEIRTNTNSNSHSHSSSTGYSNISYSETTEDSHAEAIGWGRTYVVNADGNYTRNEEESASYYSSWRRSPNDFIGFYYYSRTQKTDAFGGPDGWTSSRNYGWTYTRGGGYASDGPNQSPQPQQGDSASESGSFGSIVTYVSKQSTQEVGFNTTSSTKLYHIVGTTTTSGSQTVPTTTGTSWTEVVISETTKTTSCKIYESTSTIVSPNRKVSNHTVFELSAGEFLFTLKGNAGDTAVVGDGENPIWESYAGPKTVTISELPYSSWVKSVLDESVSFSQPSSTTSSTTYPNDPYIKAGTTTLYYNGATDTSFQTLTSSSLEANTTEFTQNTHSAQINEYGQDDSPSSSVAIQASERTTIKLSNATFNEKNYGTTSTSVGLPFLKSGSTKWTDFNEESAQVGGGESGYNEEGNYFRYLGFSASRNNGGADHWALAYNNCWGVVGDGTSATAVPKISWEANGTSIKSWDVALISKGVQTPYPAYGTEGIGTRTITDAVPTTTDYSQTKTTGIWGNEYREVTSSADSSSMTISTETFSLKAGGAPYSCIVGFETWAYIDLPSYLQTPDNVFVVGGAANIEDESVSALVHAGEYYDITLSSASTFKDKTMKRTTHEIKYVGEVVYGGNWYFMSAL